MRFTPKSAEHPRRRRTLACAEFAPEAEPQATLKLKVEINTREHEGLLGIRSYPFAVVNDWYQGAAEIASSEPEETFGTKLRALSQRRKNRIRFDLAFERVWRQLIVRIKGEAWKLTDKVRSKRQMGDGLH